MFSGGNSSVGGLVLSPYACQARRSLTNGVNGHEQRSTRCLVMANSISSHRPLKTQRGAEFDLVTPEGDRIPATLNNGIEHHHLRGDSAHTETPAEQQQSEVIHLRLDKLTANSMAKFKDTHRSISGAMVWG